MPRTLRAVVPLLLAASVALVAPVVTSAPSSARPQPHPVASSFRSTALTDLPSPSARSLGGRDAAQSAVVELQGRLHVVGLTWPSGTLTPDDRVEIRERTDGAWGVWQDLPHEDDHGPDPGSAEAAHARAGSDPWVSTAEAVQVRVVATGHRLGAAPRLDVVDPGTSPADAPADAAGSAAAQGVRPTIFTRAQWGADESLRGSRLDFGVVKAAVVHHTAGSNDYTADEVPAIIRGIYRYHVTGHGWSDIGYNFLIDKFGRTWEGRYGGMDQPVVGAHALGVNSQTYGAAIIGDFTSVVPPAVVLTAQAKLAAWKLGLSHVDPLADTTLTGFGTFSTINGHRDTYQTSCPGAQVYSRLPTIRSQARQYQGTMFYSPALKTSTVAYGAAGPSVTARSSTALTWRMTVYSVCRTEPVATSSGTAAAGATFTATWNGRLTGGSAAPPGDYRVVLSASDGSGALGTAVPVTYGFTVAGAPGAPKGFCPPRLAGANRFDVAVATARATDAATRTVVLVNGRENAMGDALVAAPLARRLGAVLLLTDAAALTRATEQEIVRRGADRVQIVGGEGSVSQAVADRLRAIGVARVDRIGGQTRYDVSASVARAVAAGSATQAFVASGSSAAMADGLGLSGPATTLGRPILLVRADEVPAATAAALKDLGISRTVVAGGPASVSDAVLAQLPSPTRIGGSDRFAVSAAVATWAAGHGVDAATALVSSGRNEALADTLSGGQLGRITLYVQPGGVPRPVASWLDSTTRLSTVTVLGGTASVSLLTGGRAQRAVL
ncbi:cell wall-binding repeat-containing protein [Nostocoides sp. Soil756]|jgi:putative cell wall-binding protein|uniref:cell wall-binding repeat-containing protein n=1 Tax=Nostocoides sp. Soil756 TaxID=1736399 RepID=UPI0006F2DC82|nr:cell wall-binding repeat-containing protein [Tetrasphaera sp. Soil756]KRE62249.1 hypothetical protein ASG78_04150 [Tetrasphaera sp. Soil756]